METNAFATTALIIFVRKPELGKVKTRLAKTIGAEKALQVYQLLLEHTLQITLPLACKKYVFYADEIPESDLWNKPDYIKKAQSDNDLGERMANAFAQLFDLGYQQVLIIGSDCYQLKTATIQQAINELATSEVVIGPTFDGGYYLLGMKKLVPKLFINKTWSTNQVANQTLADLQQLKIAYHLLEKLHDVDEAADLELNGIVI